MPDQTCRDLATREFHVSRICRDRYQFDDVLFSLTGNVLFANFHGARLFAQKINARRDLINYPEQSVQASQINAMGLIDEIMHYLIQRYQEERNPNALQRALTWLEDELGREAVDQVLGLFVETFPTTPVYRVEISTDEYLRGQTEGTTNRVIALEELLLLWLANQNPATATFSELFSDAPLRENTAYPRLMQALHGFFETQPPYGPHNQNLIDMLASPAKAVPDSLQGQLEYIRTHWAAILGRYLYRLLSSLDFLVEESRAFFDFGPGPTHPYDFAGQELEPEAFSPDRDWMPRVVMLAKNVHVWLDQLSRTYGRPITTLDQVPDEELARLQERGFTALWLIGLWQRSRASQRIKQMMGNPEAVASAYSLHAYRIADDLGGEAAFEQLKGRAWQRGIRLASDMVPNHMGIDSDWVIQHPDWFISLPQSPFPTYAFNGADLCEDPRVGIFLEDHYYSRTDAAVVFKRVDYWTGDTRYIYHGNDGTMMPWNDTAQLDYLKPEVREAVIQTILDVARRSPIIRFDAAMTLTKRHYQRLWYPEPGSGGDIASRAEYGLTKDQFDAAMPQEFWREVVDRVAQEVPDTLLLAEAFWMMEGYFVRTLGMHRVYNSAFMNMLRDEKNSEYRQLIKNTLEFDPEILKRYVNFMNNPDERTAVEQFGKGDKYFGVCTLMVTMPGLPMFGHGQIEGFAEKYGMEYRRAYWEEAIDPYLIERHQRQIFPLHHRRYLFSGVDAFLLYDFFRADGTVDENVFAYSNRSGEERALVIYHNRFAETEGWIRSSAAYAVKEEGGGRRLVQASLAEGLGVSRSEDAFLIFRDATTGLEYIRSCAALADQGLYAALHAYQTHVFIDFREIHDNEWGSYRQLCDTLGGRGVPDIEEAMQELHLAPVHAPFRMLVSAPAFRWLLDSRGKPPADVELMLSQVERKMIDVLRAVEKITQTESATDLSLLAQRVVKKLEIVLTLPERLNELAPDPASRPYAEAAALLIGGLPRENITLWGTLLGWVFTHALGAVVDETHSAQISRSWLDEWLLGKLIQRALEDSGLETTEARRAIGTIQLLLNIATWLELAEPQALDAHALLSQALFEPEVRAFLGVNRFQGILWFNQEAFATFVWWLLCLAAIELLDNEEEFAEAFVAIYQVADQLLQAEAVSGFQVNRLLMALQEPYAASATNDSEASSKEGPLTDL